MHSFKVWFRTNFGAVTFFNVEDLEWKGKNETLSGEAECQFKCQDSEGPQQDVNLLLREMAGWARWSDAG